MLMLETREGTGDEENGGGAGEDRKKEGKGGRTEEYLRIICYSLHCWVEGYET
jgi:hypothetical protein